MLPDAILTEYARKFYGFGTWNAKIWFIGIEEAGGWQESDVSNRLSAWEKREQKPLEDAPSFYPLCGNDQWHGNNSKPQATWKQLIHILLVARGKSATDEEILKYQRFSFGRAEGRECLTELLPLPSPGSKVWNYGNWSNLPWLASRKLYQNYLVLGRACSIRQMIEHNRPKVVIFYSSTWHRLWGIIARGVWSQAIRGKLMGIEREGTAFYVTRHPRVETDDYFKEIGAFLRKKHGSRR